MNTIPALGFTLFGRYKPTPWVPWKNFEAPMIHRWKTKHKTAHLYDATKKSNRNQEPRAETEIDQEGQSMQKSRPAMKGRKRDFESLGYIVVNEQNESG